MIKTVLASCALFALVVEVASGSAPVPEPPPAPEPVSFVPLPVYATLPNEGATYGFMPVFLDSDKKTGRIGAIAAPSLTWNGVSHLTATGRYFQYPNDFEERIFQVTYATRLYREAIADWFSSPVAQGEKTFMISTQYRVDPYRRFFGIGPDTSLSDETTYTLESFRAFLRGGYNLADGLNASLTVGANFFRPLNAGVLGIQSTFDRFADVPGLGGARSVYSLVALRFDTRPLREYSTSGYSIEMSRGGALSSGAKSGAYGIDRLEAKALWEEIDRVTGAAHFYFGRVFGANIPWYERQNLGGSFLLRGYILDRFVDNGAWSVDFEQRIAAAIFKVAGSIVHFRVDPFITAGQVFNGIQDAIDRVRFAYGVGLRAFAPPNVIGRIDIARNPAETNVYVELGYPF